MCRREAQLAPRALVQNNEALRMRSQPGSPLCPLPLTFPHAWPVAAALAAHCPPSFSIPWLLHDTKWLPQLRKEPLGLSIQVHERENFLSHCVASRCPSSSPVWAPGPSAVWLWGRGIMASWCKPSLLSRQGPAESQLGRGGCTDCPNQIF